MTELDLPKKPEYIHLVLNIYRFTARLLGALALAISKSSGAEPHKLQRLSCLRRRGFGEPGLRDRTEGV